MASTLRRIAAAPTRPLNTSSIFRVHECQGPFSRRYVHRSMESAFVQDPEKQVPAHQDEALFDMRKRVSRIVSHGQNIYANLLKSFAFTPVTGYYILKDTGTGVWMVSNPNKGHIKFVRDDFDRHGRLMVTKPRLIDQVLQGVEDYTTYLKTANQFVEDFCKRFNIKRTSPGAAAKAAAPETQAEEMTPRPKPKGARRDTVPLDEAPDPDLARRRFRGWQREKSQGPRKTPFLTDHEKESIIQKARKLLRKTRPLPSAKSGLTGVLEIKLLEQDA